MATPDIHTRIASLAVNAAHREGEITRLELAREIVKSMMLYSIMHDIDRVIDGYREEIRRIRDNIAELQSTL